jgi:hypothetical protein
MKERTGFWIGMVPAFLVTAFFLAVAWPFVIIDGVRVGVRHIIKRRKLHALCNAPGSLAHFQATVHNYADLQAWFDKYEPGMTIAKAEAQARKIAAIPREAFVGVAIKCAVKGESFEDAIDKEPTP